MGRLSALPALPSARVRASAHILRLERALQALPEGEARFRDGRYGWNVHRVRVRLMAADRLRPHDPLEYAKLLEWATGAKSILEIGSRYGYTLVDLAHMMDGKGLVVSIDLPGKFPWGEADSQIDLTANVKALREEGYDV